MRKLRTAARLLETQSYSIIQLIKLDGMKHYLRIEHQDDAKDLLDYLRKQAE
jgi:hypothetical protein